MRQCSDCGSNAFDNEIYCSQCGSVLEPLNCRCKYCDSLISTSEDGRCPACFAPLDLHFYPSSLALAKCKSCGKMIPKAAIYCPYCDEQVKSGSDSESADGSSQGTISDGARTAAILIAVFVLVAVIVGVGIFFHISMNKVEQNRVEYTKTYSSTPDEGELAQIEYRKITFDDIAVEEEDFAIQAGDYVEITGRYKIEYGSVTILPEVLTDETARLQVRVYAYDGGVEEKLQYLKDNAKNNDIVTVSGVVSDIHPQISIFLTLYDCEIA